MNIHATEAIFSSPSSSSTPSMTIKILTWNIEGFLRNVFNLEKIVELEIPSLIFICEPWLHLPDSHLAPVHLAHQYSYYLNSEDRHDDLLSLQKSRAYVVAPLHYGTKSSIPTSPFSNPSLAGS